MRKNHSKIVCIKLVHLFTYTYDARSHLMSPFFIHFVKLSAF